MPLTKEQKQNIIKDLKDKIDKQKSMAFVDFKSLKTKDISELKEKLNEADSTFKVAKKTLIEIAFKEKDINLDKKKLDGQTAIVFGFKDQFSPLKTVYKFLKENENLKILGGYVPEEKEKAEEYKFLESEQIMELAKLPSKQELLGQLVGSIKAPVSGFVSVLQGNIKGLIYVLSKAKT